MPAFIPSTQTSATPLRLSLFIGCICAVFAVARGNQDPPSEPAPSAEAVGILIELDAEGKLTVKEVDPADVEKNPPAHGLLLWPDGDKERWEVVKPGWKRPAPLDLAAPAVVGDHTRSTGPGMGGGDVAQLTMQLEQINPETAFRDVGLDLLTPEGEAWLLNPRPTFRRKPLKKEPRFPSLKAVLTSDALAKPITIAFAAGQEKVQLADVELPPGRFRIAEEGGADGVTFYVEELDKRKARLGPINELADLLGNRSDPLFLQYALEHTLSFPGADNVPLYLTDALDLLDSVPQNKLTRHLSEQRQRLLRSLEGKPGERKNLLVPAAAPGEATDIDEVEQARKSITSARWEKALAALDSPELQKKAAASPRTAGLAALYRGVVLAEAGPNKAEEARQNFEQALESLKGAPAEDRFRAHVNYANFLQRTAQDRVHNHALQMAAGVQQPFLDAMHNWLAARQQYEAALPLTIQLKASAAQRAAVEVNLARVYALLADIVRTLDQPKEGEERKFADGERAAAKQADKLADIVENSRGADSSVVAVALDVRALLAYRSGGYAAASAAARRALAAYLERGQMAGAENCYRLLGLTALRGGGRDARQEALKDFKVAHLLSEALRKHFPPDTNGLSRAGYFARKAYVAENIVSLLLDKGQAQEALYYLEMAKARSLQDLLATRETKLLGAAPTAASLFAKWPSGTAVVEYFLGAEKSYVFVVSPAGKVTAYLVRDAMGQPVKPRELVGRVRELLSDLEGTSGKLYNRLLAGKGYDDSWQNRLHQLYQELLPEPARKELQGAKTVVVVPQHVLHYFPFAALVTHLDDKPTKSRMVRPQFLLDEPFDLVYSPSLAAWRLRHGGKAAAIRQVQAVGLVEAPGAPALEGVKKDLENLSGTFGSRMRTVLEGDRATEAGAKKLLREPGLVFFGTHGINLADRPLDSHLLLLEADGDDGRLTAAELFGVKKFGAGLVVMSACYSGLGDRSPLPGDDLYGLQRGFLQAGANTVISGLWDVYDGTAPDLMLGLFRRLAEGQPAATALAGTQRGFLKALRASPKDEPYLHPYFWAVYTCAGDERTRFAN
jgi:CHAT domain-containing protein